MPCKSAKDGKTKPIGVRRWLMDSGTPLDLVNEPDIKGYRHLIKPVDGIVIDTANLT